MIEPEPEYTIVARPGERARIEPCAAAGHLGVIEEKCTAPFEESHWMPGIATLGGLPCEYCGAAV